MFSGKRKGPTSDLHGHSPAKTSLWSQLFRKNSHASNDAPPVWGTLGFLGFSAPSKESRTNHVKIPRSITASPSLPELQEIICAPPPRPSHAPILARQYSAGPLFPLIPPPSSHLTPPPPSTPLPPPSSHLTPLLPSSPTNTVSPPPPYPNSPAPEYTFVQAVASSPLPLKRPPRTGQTPPPRFATPVVPDDETWLPDVKLEAITITEIWQQVESKVVVYPDGDQQISDHISITGRRSVIRSRQSFYPARAGSSQSWYPRDDTPHHFSVGWIRNRRTGERFQKRSSSFFDQRTSSVFEAVSFTVSDPSLRGPSRASAFEDEEPPQPQLRRPSTPADSRRPASPGSWRSWLGETRRPMSPPMHLGPDVVLYDEQIGERTTKLYSELMEIMQISLRELAPPTAKITEIEPEEIPSEPAAKPPSGSRVSTKQSTVLDTPASASPEKASASETDQDSPPRQTKGPRGPRPSPFLQKQKSWKRMFSGPY